MQLYSTSKWFCKNQSAWGIFYFLSEYARNFKRAINPACIQLVDITHMLYINTYKTDIQHYYLVSFLML